MPGTRPRAKRSLGQNFLVDENYVSKIISSISPSESDMIIEIGPGTGVLTQRLLDSGANVTAIELDRRLVPELRHRFASFSKFSIIEADAVTVDYDTFVPISGEKLRLVANLPYYISTAILQHLVSHRNCFSDLTLMFQLEVVRRIIAEPGSSERGFLTVMIETFFDSQKLFDVPPASFRPAPKVNSAVVRLTPRDNSMVDASAFRSLVSAAFAQKRKTIVNNLKLVRENARDLLSAAYIDPERRAETLTNAEWQALHNVFVEDDRSAGK